MALRNGLYIRQGETITYTCGADGVKYGDVVVVGTIIGIAATDGQKDDVISLDVVGVFQLAKANVAITKGAQVYYSTENKNITTTATDNILAGVAWSDAITSDTSVDVKINS